MTAIRVALWIVGTLSGGYAMAAVWLLPWLDFGVSVAISASCVIGLGLVRAIETDRQRDLDKARHPSVRYWNADWQEIESLTSYLEDDGR